MDEEKEAGMGQVIQIDEDTTLPGGGNSGAYEFALNNVHPAVFTS